MDLDTFALKRSTPPERVFELQNAVRLFFIPSDGSPVTTESSALTLSIHQFDSDLSMIHCNGWTHALISKVSPALQEPLNGAIIFPNLKNKERNGSVGIIFDPGFEDAKCRFVEVLRENTDFKLVGEYSEREDLGTVGKVLVNSAEVFREAVDGTTDKACDAIERRADRKIARSEAADPDKKCNPVLKYPARGISAVTGAASKVTGKSLMLYHGSTFKLGQKIAEGTSDKVAATADASHAFDSVMDATYGGVVLYDTVHDSLTRAAIKLCRSIRDNKVRVVEHRHGVETGQAARDLLQSVGHVAKTAHHIDDLTEALDPMDVGMRLVRDVSRAVARQHGERKGYHAHCKNFTVS